MIPVLIASDLRGERGEGIEMALNYILAMNPNLDSSHSNRFFALKSAI